jgi:hypothetical protein
MSARQFVGWTLEGIFSCDTSGAKCNLFDKRQISTADLCGVARIVVTDADGSHPQT